MPPTERLSEQPQLSAAGQAELTTRRHRLSQRHRTVLFLVDGRRSEEHVRALAAQAGAGVQCLDDLVQLGLIVRPGDARQDAGCGNESSLLPSSQSLQGESTWSVAEDDKAAPTDRPLAEARELLVRSVRQEAPVAGALTLMKLKRASSRELVWMPPVQLPASQRHCVMPIPSATRRRKSRSSGSPAIAASVLPNCIMASSQ